MKNTSETLAKRNALRRHWREVTPLDSFPHMIEKKCKVCAEVKPHSWASSFTQTGKPEYMARCVECMRKYHSGRRKTSRTKVTSQTLDRKFLRKSKAVTYLGGKCRSCGYDRCVKAMTFHHRDPSEKTFTVSQILDHSWELVRQELDKCDLLCFNCHMEEHCGIDQDARVIAGSPKQRGCQSHDSEV